MSAPLRWSRAQAGVRAAVEAAYRSDRSRGHADTRLRRVAESRWRSLSRLERDGAGDLLLKHFRVASGPHPWRERIKAALGRSAAQREWRALRGLHAAGAPVPEPLGLARLADGDLLLVASHVEGDVLHAMLDARHAARGPLPDADAALSALASLAAAVHALHAAGWCHGDLHPGNVIVSHEGAVIVDLQRSRRCRRGSARQLRDLGLLDAALARQGIPARARTQVVRRALGSGDPPARADARRERAVARASRRAQRRHRRRFGAPATPAQPAGGVSSG